MVFKGRYLCMIEPDETLAKITGKEPFSSAQFMKKVWIYARKSCKVYKADNPDFKPKEK